jgi:phosphoglycerate kinase
MQTEDLDPRLRLIQDADMKGKIVLVRVDHNVVKKGEIKDPYRIEVTFKTLYAIAEGGGRPILMTHVGRPKDKKTGHIKCQEGESVRAIVQYLEQKLPVKIHVPEFSVDSDKGILHVDDSIKTVIGDLLEGRAHMIYLPNTRWFWGEQSKGPERDGFAQELAGLADLFVNDAFGSWQAHVSTYDIAKELPSYAGLHLQKEIVNLNHVLQPERPFLGVIAGAKYDTKIGPLKALYQRADHMILGGIIYNVYLAAKYQVNVSGISEEEKNEAMELVEMDKREKKILEMPLLVESETTKGKIGGQYRTIDTHSMKRGDNFNYLLDIDPRSFERDNIMEVIGSAKTIFVNAVMGLTPPFFEGTQALYRLIASNRQAHKLFGGGDTLQELRNLCPGIYLDGMDAPDYYYFTGGGSVLTTLEQGSPYHLKPIEVLMEEGS